MLYHTSRAHRLAACVLGGATLLGAAEAANAQTRIYDTSVSSCTGINCSSMLVQGSLLAYGGAYQAPWTALVWVGQGQCVRIENVSRTRAARIFVFWRGASPAGATAGVADPTAGPFDAYWAVMPRSDLEAGWRPIVVNVATLAGPSPIETHFTLAVGAYPVSNPNCTENAPAGLAGKRT